MQLRPPRKVTKRTIMHILEKVSSPLRESSKSPDSSWTKFQTLADMRKKGATQSVVIKEVPLKKRYVQKKPES